MTPKDPFFGGDFLGQILASDSLPGAFVHSQEEQRTPKEGGGGQKKKRGAGAKPHEETPPPPRKTVSDPELFAVGPGQFS